MDHLCTSFLHRKRALRSTARVLSKILEFCSCTQRTCTDRLDRVWPQRAVGRRLTRASPLTRVQRPRARWAVEAIDTSAYDPNRLFGQVASCNCSCHNLRLSPKPEKGYSITSSARSSIDVGTVRPSALAVLRFTTISNLVGNWTGRSAG